MIRFLDLSVADDERRELLEAFDRVLTHGRLILGPEVGELEQQVATRVGVKHAIGVGSGTDALIVALRALGIGAGDEVIVPAMSFIATANAVSLVDATPVFADIRDDLNIDPDIIETLIGPKTRAIMPVHWAGLVCDMERICAIADKHGLYVIEDASQAFGAKGVGKTIGCFSMNSMKTFASLGEAGMIVTSDSELAETCRTLRYHGIVDKERCVALAQNSRLDTLQAAALLVRMKRLDGVIHKRCRHASIYDSLLCDFVSIPKQRHAYYTYTIQTDRRDELKSYLDEIGIETKIQHPILMPHHPAYLTEGSWPNASRLVDRILCLPVHEKLYTTDIMNVSQAVSSFMGNQNARRLSA